MYDTYTFLKMFHQKVSFAVLFHTQLDACFNKLQLFKFIIVLSWTEKMKK